MSVSTQTDFNILYMISLTFNKDNPDVHQWHVTCTPPLLPSPNRQRGLGFLFFLSIILWSFDFQSNANILLVSYCVFRPVRKTVASQYMRRSTGTLNDRINMGEKFDGYDEFLVWHVFHSSTFQEHFSVQSIYGLMTAIHILVTGMVENSPLKKGE